MRNRRMLVPPRAPKDAGISVVAPSGSPPREACREALDAMRNRGYRVVTYRDFESDLPYLCGSDRERADEFNRALADPKTDIVLAVRGGYGAARILADIDFRVLRRRPKWVCGFSDITAIHCAIQRHAGVVSVHGPNLVWGWGDADENTRIERAAIDALVHDRGLTPHDSLLGETTGHTRCLADGKATGRLVGGNLAVLVSLIGSDFAPDFRQAILYFEDVGEAPYRIDRMLMQLQLAGAFDDLRGVVIGHFTRCEGPGFEKPGLDALFMSFFKPLRIPVLAGVTAGHAHPNLPMPMGAAVQLDAKAQTLQIADERIR